MHDDTNVPTKHMLPNHSSLDAKVGGCTLRERLYFAISNGHLVVNEDGRFAQPIDSSAPTVPNPTDPFPIESYFEPVQTGFSTVAPCRLMYRVLFPLIYTQAQVPFGCQHCYKVRVVAMSLSELMALKKLAENLQCRSKWGPEIDNPYTPDQYAGYFYAHSLEQARDLKAQFSQLIGDHDQLRKDVQISIKRGCSAYERQVGKSDTWTFPKELEEFEVWFQERWTLPSPNSLDKQLKSALWHKKFALWLATAYRMGDESYKEFTGGKPLYRQNVSYD